MKTRAFIIIILIISMSVLSYLWLKEPVRPQQPTTMQKDSVAYANKVLIMPTTDEERGYYSVGMRQSEGFDEYFTKTGGLTEEQLPQVLWGLYAYYRTTNDLQMLYYYIGVSCGGGFQSNIIPNINKQYFKGNEKLSTKAFLAGFIQSSKGSVKIKNLNENFLKKE